MLNQKHKVIILTGADGDIGRSIARELSRQSYDLILLDKHFRDHAWIEGLKEMGANIEYYLVDLAASEQVVSFFADLTKRKVSIWALINNAGIYPIIKLSEYSLSLWNHVLTINLTAPYLCSQLVSPLLVENGAIVNISSTGAFLGSRDPGYASSKAGLIGLTKSLARNLASQKIRVNAVAPGMIDTQMSQSMLASDKAHNLAHTLLGREGQSDDVAGVVSFLVSSQAGYVTGTTIDVNGGLYLR